MKRHSWPTWAIVLNDSLRNIRPTVRSTIHRLREYRATSVYL